MTIHWKTVDKEHFTVVLFVFQVNQFAILESEMVTVAHEQFNTQYERYKFSPFIPPTTFLITSGVEKLKYQENPPQTIRSLTLVNPLIV